MGFGRPLNFVSTLLTKEGLTREPEIHVLGPSLPGSAGKDGRCNGFVEQDGNTGLTVGNGKRKNLHHLKKWLELHQDSLQSSDYSRDSWSIHSGSQAASPSPYPQHHLHYAPPHHYMTHDYEERQQAHHNLPDHQLLQLPPRDRGTPDVRMGNGNVCLEIKGKEL